jgi:hypothetical protein
MASRPTEKGGRTPEPRSKAKTRCAAACAFLQTKSLRGPAVRSENNLAAKIASARGCAGKSFFGRSGPGPRSGGAGQKRICGAAALQLDSAPLRCAPRASAIQPRPPGPCYRCVNARLRRALRYRMGHPCRNQPTVRARRKNPRGRRRRGSTSLLGRASTTSPRPTRSRKGGEPPRCRAA